MKIVFLTNSLSPHQIPLASNISELVGKENFTYIYTHSLTKMRKQMGWSKENQPFNLLQDKADCEAVLSCDVLVSGIRDMDVFLYRAKKNKASFYMSERWFKPPWGMLRILHPKFLFMCCKFMKLFQYDSFTYLPIGIHAAKDIVRLWKIMHGKLEYLFKQPKVAFEAFPGGKIVPLELVASSLSEIEWEFARKNNFVSITKRLSGQIISSSIYNKMRLWGYFVEKSSCDGTLPQRKQQVLWVGRMDRLKHLPSIIKACIRCGLPMEIYGHGEDEDVCRELAKNSTQINFNDYVSIKQVRKLMQISEIYIFGSDGADGWGAVVNEALCEGMKVIGSIEAGASATILPLENLFHCGNVKELTVRLKKNIKLRGIGKWTAEKAASVLMTLLLSVSD